jgi:septum formation protein
MRQIVLASQSPRRKELLRAMGITDFLTVPSDYDEQLDDARTPEHVSEELGLGKAMAVAQQYPDAIIIGSDTIVTIDGRQLAKADTIDEARQMLRDESEHPNKVTSSLAVICIAEHYQFVQSENAWVYFKPYDTERVEKYLATGDYADKAGAYGIQSGAAPLIHHMSGNPDVVVGLPTHLLAPVLQRFGFDAEPVDYRLPRSVKVLPPQQ